MEFFKKSRLYLLLIGFISFLSTIILLKNNNRGNVFFSLLYNIPYYDKIGHFNLMGILTFLAVISIAPNIPVNQPKSTLIVSSAVLVIIVLEEFSQILVPTRTFSLIDLLCDFLGVLFYGYLGNLVITKKSKNC